MTIYIVQGTTGEYSDHREWMFKAYTNRDKAMSVIKELEVVLLSKGMRYEDDYFNIPYSERLKLQEEFKSIDPKFEYDYTGSKYNLLEVELET